MAMPRAACAPGTPQGPASSGKEPKMQREQTQGEVPGKVSGPGALRVHRLWGYT